MTMMQPVQTAKAAGPLDDAGAGRSHACGLRAGFCAWAAASLIGLVCASVGRAQQSADTGPQQLLFAGLRAVANQAGVPEGQINAVRSDAQGNLFLLIDQKDGVRLLKTDAAGANVLAQAQIGAQGDIGLAMAFDPTGDVYVTGTTTSGALTATAGAAFLAASGTSTNSFVAKFDTNLNLFFVTFAGGGFMAANSIAATSDAVFIAGNIFSATLPVTPAGIIQTAANGSTSNGFVEKFSANGGTLLYATYLSGAGGNTAPAGIAADDSDDAYIAGTTSAPGYPTVAAVVPAMLSSAALGTSSGFLTKLTPGGDGITFSTFIPGAGMTSIAIDPVANNLLLSGAVSLGQFPVASVGSPLTAVSYQVLLRMSVDGSSVLGSTVLAPGAQSFVAAGANGTAWVGGALGLPLFPLTPLASFGNSFAVRVNAANAVDEAARFGGMAASNASSASAPVTLTSIAVDGSGDAILGGSFGPSASESLLATQTFDLPLENAPTAAFPSTVHGAVLPASACGGSLCSGSAAYLAKLTAPASAAAAQASLALSVDDSPNLTLRNLGSSEATGVQITVSGFSSATNCAATLVAGGECSIALTGSGPGSITVSAGNAAAQTQTLPALAAGVAQAPVVFSPKELDFGIVSSASGAVTRTIMVTNLTQQSQTFTSALNIGAKTTLPYTIAEQASDCTTSDADSTKLLAPGGVCHITIGLTASNTASNDGAIEQTWLIGARTVQLTAYGQAAALSLSASEVDFGTQYASGLRLPRYLYLSNNSTTTIGHAAVTLPATSPFSVTDGCPSELGPLTVCQLAMAYQGEETTSADAVTLSLDQGLTVLVTGRSLPQPAVNGLSVNPNLNVSATSLNFATTVGVTAVSESTETLTIHNIGLTPFALSLAITGDFTDTTNCGATLAGNGSCSVVLSFAPSQPGTREGLLAVTAGAGTTPAYVALSGVGTGIISPANNGVLSFGSVIAGQPEVEWYKITQPFTSFAATVAPVSLGLPYTVVLVEDIGYGHGQPPSSAFAASATGTCFNCWLGVQFTPVTTNTEIGTLSLSSALGGSAYVLSLNGSGLPLTGLVLSPVAQDFGPVPINSTSGTALFALTNLVAAQGAITVAAPAVTGEFAVSNAPSGGATCGGTLAYTASCYVEAVFAPTAAGVQAGTLTLQGGGLTATAALTGYGSADPGLALSPTALVFNNVPGATATQQSVTLTNTSGAAETIGTPLATTTSSAATSFAEANNCGTLAAGAMCSITVTYMAATAPAAGTLAIPVTSSVGGAPVLTTYTVPLTGVYTTEDAGLEIVDADAEYGPQATGAMGATRQFTIDNLTSKSLTLSVGLPRQFVLSGAPCAGLAPNASCNFSVAFLPLAGGDITGTLFATATPTDGSATFDGLGYVEGYGLGAGALSITSAGLLPGGVLGFGQVPSGGSAQQTLTLTNGSSTQPLTVRRITSEWPFLATSTCGATLGVGQSCSVTLNYTPINQVAAGANSPVSSTDSGTLVIESDAASSPDLIDLGGSSTPVTVASPSNTAPLAAFVASQSSLTFATTMAGDVSAPQSVTLDNTGTATLSILGLQTSADFSVTSNCSTIVPGASCTLMVNFTPQNSVQLGASKTRVSAVEISSNASTPLEFISLAGTASAPTLVLAQTSLDFGTVLVGTTFTQGVQVTNTGASSITFNSISATGDYSVANGSCPAPGMALAANTSCMPQITFAPTQSGALAGTLSIATSATTLPLTVALTGMGAQSHLQISPASLSFGEIAVGAPASQSLTLANTGTASITGVGLAVTGDYAVTVPCAVTTLTAGGSCSVTVTFTPTAIGVRNGTLTVTSSDATSPDAVPLSGSGIGNGSFTLTIKGASSASATVAGGSGSPASYSLTVTPVNSFSGTVVLSCTPVTAAQYGSCSLLPSSVTLSGAVQNAVATLNTVTSVGAARAPARPGGGSGRSLGDTALGLLLPGLMITWTARRSRRSAWRRAGPMAWALVASVALLSAGGCGGSGSNSNANPDLRYVAPGKYQYQVSASSVSGGTQITQTVTLNLTVQ
jgi:hypothetical protein